MTCFLNQFPILSAIWQGCLGLLFPALLDLSSHLPYTGDRIIFKSTVISGKPGVLLQRSVIPHGVFADSQPPYRRHLRRRRPGAPERRPPEPGRRHRGPGAEPCLRGGHRPGRGPLLVLSGPHQHPPPPLPGVLPEPAPGAKPGAVRLADGPVRDLEEPG